MTPKYESRRDPRKSETTKPVRRPNPSALLWLALTLAAGAAAGRSFLSMQAKEDVRPSPALTARRTLADYFPPLKGSPGDTDVFVFEGGTAGGRVLVVGGTHPNEPAGFVSAVVLTENLRVQAGAVIVVPRANASGFTLSDPQEASPQRFILESRSGRRSFRLGSRATNPVHQWPDPVIYRNPGGQDLAGMEARNLNRAYPGKPRGSLTEKVAFGIMELICREKIDLAIDLHESAPEYPVINAIVFNEAAADLAAVARMELETEGFDFRLEASPPGLRGLSHREWGEASGVEAILLETANASHGRLKGKPSASLVVDGRDRFYTRAASLGRLFVPFGPEGIPLKERVARHLAGIAALLRGLSDLEPGKAIALTGIPDPVEVREKEVGAFLR